ncbi:LytR/AlgR family response regulator transcription factor [Chitinophaga filiformis]|uniref:DNA-binding response regulator, LytR/AlgR family n=1 Tax=Chitinophaga filiformis TaxID=104663 RepID=A0A1G7MKT8_CHIFI|nr:LytTR family DNA-binding domain-containing protein [Chitinophaga filiformis]SDF61759.1 DNA-binding response regulator, LytR/AlgR family [Chitinophaga filiformis]
MSNANTQRQPERTLLSCFVIDDEQAAINKLEYFIKITQGLDFIGAEKDPLKAHAMLSKEKGLPDVVFLDIEMKGPLGLKLARLVMNKVLVVFTTGHSQFAVEAYRLNAIDYLMKPITYPHFLEAVAKCRLKKETADHIAKDEASLLFLKDSLSGQTTKVNHDDILYIQSIGNYCKIYFTNKSQIMPHMALKQILSQLRSDRFIRIHKSYVINMKHIQFYEGNGTIKIVNDIKLEVGRTFKKDLKEKIKEAHGK